MRVDSGRRILGWLEQQRPLAIFATTAFSVLVYLPAELLHHLGPPLSHPAWAVVLMYAGALAWLPIVAFATYRQMNGGYPYSANAYSVARDRLGHLPRLAIGAGLLASFLLAVAVSVSAGASALVALWPALAPYRVALAIGVIFLSCLLHIRGHRVLTLTYVLVDVLFSGTVLLALSLVAKHVGLIGWSHLPPTALLLLSAVGAGSAVIIGVSTLSSGRRTATRWSLRLFVGIVGLLLILFAGTIWFAGSDGVSLQSEPILSHLAGSAYGSTLGRYLIQAMTVAILLVTGQTLLAAVSQVVLFITRGVYLPQQFASWHDPRSRADSIFISALCTTVLVVSVHAAIGPLLPWYVAATYITFMVAQAGMAARCALLKLTAWRQKLLLHSISVVVSYFMLALITGETFTSAPWVLPSLIAILLVLTLGIHHLAIMARQSHRA